VVRILLDILGPKATLGSLIGPDTQCGSWCIDVQVEELLSSSVNVPSAGPRNFVDEKVFAFLVNHEVEKATRLQYYLSILCMTPDLPPTDVTGALTEKLTQVAISHLRATDVASTFRSSCVALLLVDAETHSLPKIFRRLTEAAYPFSPFTLSAGGACYPQTALRGSELLQQAMELMIQARAEGGNRLNLP
jgi:hypothetical protein